MCVCSVPIYEAKVNRWKPSPATWSKTRLLARVRRHSWKEQATKPRQKWQVIHSRAFYSEDTLQRPRNCLPAQSRCSGAAARCHYLLPLPESLPHHTRLRSEQAFWEFWQGTEEQCKFSFITNKTLRVGAQKSALQKGTLAGGMAEVCSSTSTPGCWPPQPRPSTLRTSQESNSFLIHRASPTHPATMPRASPPLKSPRPFPPLESSFGLRASVPVFGWQIYSILQRPDQMSPCLWRLPQRALVYTGPPLRYHLMIFLLTSEFFFLNRLLNSFKSI